MAPPAGTLRVGRYFAALLAIVALLYSIVALGSRHSPKLGLDLVGGIRVIFTAQTPAGSPPPTSSQMTQARQILEDRINTTGVTGATVVVQGSDQMIVEIPNGTSTDVARLGKAAILNFRGVIAPAQPVTCLSRTAARAAQASAAAASAASTGNASSAGAGAGAGATSSGSSSAQATGSAADPSASAASVPAPSAPAPSVPALSATAPSATALSATAPSATSAHTPADAGSHPLAAAAPSGASKSTAPKSTAPKSTAPKSTAPKSTAPKSTAPKSTGPASGSGSPAGGSASPSTTPSAPTTAPTCQADPFAAAIAADPSLKAKMPNAETCPSPALDSSATCTAYTALSAAQQAAIASALQRVDCANTQLEPDVPTSYYYACDTGKTYGTKIAYLLGHVVVPGQLIDSASAQAPSGTGGQLEYTVALTLTSKGGDRWNAFTSAYHTTDTSAAVVATTPGAVPCGPTATTPCSDFVGFTLDGQVISAPVTEAALDINTSISGNFTAADAKSLAQELNYGKLPVSFRADANQKVSATLGSKQLSAALLAGGIGLLLVVIYSLIYYRGLGLVTIASLLVSALMTYAMLVLLSTQIGFTLDLAGIAGFIVALGITADSFVVFFERLKDEVHEGRSVRVAVPRAWVRARRTILSADTVSFLAAAILYYFASAEVKGFAFTLGMSTILDLVVVFLFTHPMVSLLSRSRTFGSARFTGLDAVRGSAAAIPDTPVDPADPADPTSARARRTRSVRGGATALREHPVSLAGPTDEPVDVGGAPPVPLDPASGAGVADPPAADARGVDSDASTVEHLPTSGASPAPSSGTAAERAAARRARLRQQRDEKGES